MDILNGAPVKAFIWQDHEAHISTHMAASQDPQMQELLAQAPNAPAIQGAFMSHVTEHLAFQYRRQIEEHLGMPLPPPDEPLPDQVEVELSKLVADASRKLQEQQAAQQAQQQAQQQAEDPIIQMRQQELAIRQQEAESKIVAAQAKSELDAAKAQMDMMKFADNSAMEKAKIDSAEAIAGARVAADVFDSTVRSQEKDTELKTKEVIEGARLAEKVTEKIIDVALSENKEREIEDRVRKDRED